MRSTVRGRTLGLSHWTVLGQRSLPHPLLIVAFRAFSLGANFEAVWETVTAVIVQLSHISASGPKLKYQKDFSFCPNV